MQTQYTPRANVVDELMREYEADTDAMYANITHIARKHGLVQFWEHVSDDDAEEMVKEAMGQL